MFKIGDEVKVICEDSVLEKGSTFIIKKIGIWNGEALYMDINKSRCAGVIASEIILVKEEEEEKKMTKTFKEVIADMETGIWESRGNIIEIYGNTINLGGLKGTVFMENEKFTLQRTKVSNTEAFKSYKNGKEIESCVTGRRYDVRNKNQSLMAIEEVMGYWYIN